ncbi:DinB family protein [Chitinophaga sp. Ak27]|uniref:DinB family protein n=1 Tax=Chitinophaga sp. Ak27 TaxID=2726116 RepID=UPI00145D43BC|nr:DinB family protein [Chitinophaga sp. Ak27]NLU92062.1 DinB family protein [Chitinophaga sp. Ak27]
MNATKQIAKHFRDVHLGGNWTSVNLKDTLTGISWQQATTQIDDLNTIAVLVFHINYYVGVITRVLQGGPLEGNDKLSFNVPLISSEEAWQTLVNKSITEAEEMTVLIEKLDDTTLQENFTDPKYGTYFRNLLGVTEHTHYHLGQIAILKKIVRNSAQPS